MTCGSFIKAINLILLNNSNQIVMTHPLFQGLLMGGAIFAADMLLRPMLATSNLMQILLFFVEGIACDIVYAATCRCGGGSGDFLSGINLKRSAIAGVVIWITDFILMPQVATGFMNEMLKFGIQGLIVVVVFAFGGV